MSLIYLSKNKNKIEAHLKQRVLSILTLFVLSTFQTEVGVTLTPPTGTERAEGWAGLQGVRELKIKYEELDR